MPSPYISVLVLIIAALGGWIVKSRFSETAHQEGSNVHDVEQSLGDYGNLDMNTKVGLAYLDDVSRSLGVIKTIHITRGFEQTYLEEIIGEKLVTDSFLRLELLHDETLDEGQVFNRVFLGSIPELEDELAHGLTSEIWDLTEIVIEDLHAYSKKLVRYGKHMIVGLENAKLNGKFKNVDTEVTKKLVLIAGGEKCACDEWKTLYEMMVKYVEWVGKGLKLKYNIINDKKKTLNEILEWAKLAGTFADRYVSNIGITSLSSNHSTWIEQERGEAMVPIVYEIVEDKEESMKLQEIPNLFLAIGFTTKFRFQSQGFTEVYSRRYELPTSKGPYGAMKLTS